MPKKLTLCALEMGHACAQEIESFHNLFGMETEVTEEAMNRYATRYGWSALMNGINWIAEHLFTPTQAASYYNEVLSLAHDRVVRDCPACAQIRRAFIHVFNKVE